MNDFQLIIAPSAVRQLDRLPEKVATAIAEFLFSALIVDPLRVGKPLGPPFEGRRSARRGVYRIVYRVSGDVIEVIRIEHRSTAYRPR